MIKFYYHPSPNPLKVALFLEEAGLDYETAPIDTRKGEQHAPAFLKINPNAKTPAMTDGDVALFDSNAMLLYLAEKTGKFLPPAGDANRAQLLSWLMFVATGIGPYSGQFVHFSKFAPEPKDYAVNRYSFEAERHWGILDAHLTGRAWMVGDAYTIADMSVWGWSRLLPFIFGDGAWETFPNVKRHLDAINARPAAGRAEGLKAKFEFKQDYDAAARAAMFPQNERLATV